MATEKEVKEAVEELGQEVRANGRALRGLTFQRVYSDPSVSPYDAIEWELRTAAIVSEKGETIFEQKNVEVPKSWSQTATNIVVQKYFHGRIGTPERETSVRQLIERVAGTITGYGEKGGYFRTAADRDAFHDELAAILVNQVASFNSPVWFNVGIEPKPQGSACFINSCGDSMDSILSLAKTEGMLFKFGSGTGSNLSSIRGSHESLSAGGTASGPLSFMKGFDSFAGAIKSGGKTRRAAKMVILNIDHPDVDEFILSKANEEKKAWALIDSGYDGSFNGEAYASIFYQNANHSVRVTDEFMDAVEKDGEWQTKEVLTGRPYKTYKARELMAKIAESAWVCGDPGMQYDSTINQWNPVKATHRINASNPCSEYMFVDDSACNLASLNLMKFFNVEDGSFDVPSFRHACDVVVTAQEMLVDNCSYPTPAIAANSHKFRPLGLGYANLGALLMAAGLPYDSDEGRAYSAAITSLMCGEAYLQSSKVASELGTFSGYPPNREAFLEVIGMHRHAAYEVPSKGVPTELFKSQLAVWDAALESGTQYGYKNGQVTVLAPTGTIGFMMDCDTTGVEPDLALVKYKKLVGGGTIKIVNQTVPLALRRLGYDDTEIHEIVDYVDEKGTIEGAPNFHPEHLPVFDCAFRALNGTRSIHYIGPRPHDVGRPALPLGRDLEDRQPAARRHARRDRRRLHGRLEAGPQGHRHLPRRLQADAAPEHRGLEERHQVPDRARLARVRRQGHAARALALPPQAPRRAPLHHPQVLGRRPRGLRHRRPLRGRQARRDLPPHVQGRLDHLRPHGRLRHGHLADAPVRRPPRRARQQVHPRPLRALRLHQEPRDPDRQVPHRLHLQVARVQVHDRGREGSRRRHRQGHGVVRAHARHPAVRRGPVGRGGRGVEAAVRDLHRRPCVPRVRLDHGAERRLLQVHELRGDERV